MQAIQQAAAPELLDFIRLGEAPEKNPVRNLHLFLIVLVLFSPILITLPWLLIGMVIQVILIRINGGCILTKIQFGRADFNFTAHYTRKWFFPNATDSVVHFCQGRIQPVILVAWSYWWQIHSGKQVFSGYLFGLLSQAFHHTF